MRVIEYILSTIAPHYCVGCDQEGSLLCDSCAVSLPAVPERCYRCLRSRPSYITCQACRKQSALFSVQPFTLYDGQAKELVHKLKFERAKAGAGVIADLLAKNITLLPNTVITHVPTATGRVRERGYDQAALIAKQFASKSGTPYLSLLARLGQQRQVGKTRAERQRQMQELFIVIKQNPPAHVLLVDDVITTGATLEVCARVLKNAGVKKVSAIVFAAA